MVDGKFIGTDETAPAGQDIVAGLLDRCFLWSEIVLERYSSFTSLYGRREVKHDHRQGQIDQRFKSTYDGLLEIRNSLERLSLTQAWSLRETDLYTYQRRLDRIDEGRIDGNFEDAFGKPADLHAQRVSVPYSQATASSNKLGDSIISSSAQLRIYLQLDHFVRACI